LATARESGQGGRLFVISGPSGAGKGTVVRAALAQRPDVFLSVSMTTRPARPGERNGVDYRFVTREEFQATRDRGGFLESAEVYGCLYGTPREPVEHALAAGRDVVCELDIQGAMSIKRSVPNSVLIFIEPPSFEELTRRLRGRGTEDPETQGRRIRAAYEEIKQKRIYDHIVVNDDAARATEELLRILDKTADGNALKR
jgi:guanylate kinase